MHSMQMKVMSMTAYVVVLHWLSFAGAIGTDPTLVSEAGYFTQRLNPDKIIAVARDLPDCGVCEYDLSIYKDGAILNAICPQNARYREETFKCDRYVCSNNYVKIHISWGNCINEAIDSDCPAGTCQ